MRKYSLFILLMLLLKIAGAQNIDKPPIYLDLIDDYISIGKLNSDTSIVADKYSILLTCHSDSGKCFFICTLNDGVIKGQYVSSLDIFSKYRYVSELESPDKLSVIVFKYFYPLRNGTWEYFRKNKKTKIEKYENGLLIKE